jgi:hypothetical protein
MSCRWSGLECDRSRLVSPEQAWMRPDSSWVLRVLGPLVQSMRVPRVLGPMVWSARVLRVLGAMIRSVRVLTVLGSIVRSARVLRVLGPMVRSVRVLRVMRTPRVHLHQQHLLLLQHRQHRLRHHLLGQLLGPVQESSTSSLCWRMKARKTEDWPNRRPCAWTPRTGPRGHLGLHPRTHDARERCPLCWPPLP